MFYFVVALEMRCRQTSVPHSCSRRGSGWLTIQREGSLPCGSHAVCLVFECHVACVQVSRVFMPHDTATS